MKKRILFLLISCFGMMNFLKAQDTTKINPLLVTDLLLKQPLNKNVIKLNLSSLLFTSFNVQYERAVSKKISLALQGGFLAPRHLPKLITKQDSTGTLSDISFHSWSVTPELRWYTSNKRTVPTGFYLAPYIRYMQNISKTEFDVHYTNTADNQDVAKVILKGTYSGLGLGMMMGSQFRIGKHVMLDWFIGSMHYGIGRVALKASTDFSNSKDLQELQKEIEDVTKELKLPLFDVGKTLNTVVSYQEVKISSNGFPYFGIRTAGLNLGIAF